MVKEMARREAAWAALTDWAIELLVQKALETANTEMTPSKSLMRVLEVGRQTRMLGLAQKLFSNYSAIHTVKIF